MTPLGSRGCGPSGCRPHPASFRHLSVCERGGKSRLCIMARRGQCPGEGRRVIPEPFPALFAGMEYLAISETLGNSARLVKLPCSLRNRASKFACRWPRGRVCAAPAQIFGEHRARFFLKTFPRLPAAPSFITLDKFTVLKRPINVL